ncbi:MAG: hypothetical protein KDJ17_08470, partial [Hyphomicrobiaceae bacterium]|nr:hypothetical protein [Hyphomicrobiaceae bacterium]
CAAAAILARVADRNVRPSETDKEALAVRDRRPLDAPSTSEPPAEPVKPLEQFAKYLSPGVLALEINAALEAIKPRLAKTIASFPENREPDNPAVDVVEVAAPAEAAPPAPADDLSLIRSMPARVAIRLEELGIRRFADVADFDADDVAALSVDCGLGDQINEECWIEQAAILAAGRLTKAALANQRERRMCVVPHPVQPLVQDRGLITELASRSAELIAAEPEQTSSNTSAAALVGLAEAVAQDCSVPHPAPVKPMVTVLEAPKPRKSHVETIAPSGVAAKRLSSLPSRSPEAQPTVATTQIDPSPPSPPKVRRPEPSPQVVEAEVYFKPKVASRLSAMDDAFDASGYDAGSEPGPLEHKLSDPDSLQSKLDKAGAPDDMNADDYAAYHRDIEEASVEIVRNKSGATMRNNASAEAGSVRGDGAQSASVSRFLKALRGH